MPQNAAIFLETHETSATCLRCLGVRCFYLFFSTDRAEDCRVVNVLFFESVVYFFAN
jgi:hypothetical protein